jgi:hypothetical protein
VDARDERGHDERINLNGIFLRFLSLGAAALMASIGRLSQGDYRDVSDDEALLSYGENLETTSQLAAAHIDKIVRGAGAAELVP